jgi:hypothetical protein
MNGVSVVPNSYVKKGVKKYEDEKVLNGMLMPNFRTK